MRTAQTGRTHDLHPTASRKPKKSLDPWAPSTHDPKDFLSKANGGRTVSKYAINQTIFQQGDPAVSIFYILTGEVKLTVTSEQGKEAVVALCWDSTVSLEKDAWTERLCVLQPQLL